MKILKICLNRMFIFGVLILLQVLWLGFFTSSLLKSYVWLRPLMFIMSSAVVLWLVSKDEIRFHGLFLFLCFQSLEDCFIYQLEIKNLPVSFVKNYSQSLMKLSRL